MKHQQNNRENYHWHLRPPFDGKFDRSHWWKKTQTDVEPIAALYELARRHPLVGLRRTQPLELKKTSPAIICLGDISLKSWPELTAGQKAEWKLCADNLKGVDCRTDEEKCYDIAWQNEGEPLNHLVGLKKGAGFPAAADLEAGVARRAIEAYRQGHVLLAVAPGLAQDEAAALLASKYGEHRQFDKAVHRVGKQRERHEDWLALIAEFESDFHSKAGVKSDVFTRYKRAIDGIKFVRR
jgi:hypothetical protein